MTDWYEKKAQELFERAQNGGLTFERGISGSDLWRLISDVAGALRAAVAAEREACAKITELPPITDTILCGDTCDYIATAIRARKE